jgi:multidrug efflux pump subunit AcrB
MSEEIKIPNNAEIEQALKEFEAQNTVQQAQKAPEISKNPDVPKMVNLVIKSSGGAVKDRRQAEWILFAVVCFIVLISIVILFRSTYVAPAAPTALPSDYNLYHNYSIK